jgi:hypothetical protein
MKDTMHIIKRVTVPTQYTFEPYKTQWRYTDSDGIETCYIQMSRDESNPHWIKYGDLLEYVFYDRLEDDKFMELTVESYAIKE